MSDNTLYVPLEVKALVVNDKVRLGQNFQRWTMNYNSLSDYVSPMPTPFSGNNAINWPNEPGANGVYLHWTLPEALRRGIQQDVAANTKFPLVPNRWLVLRYSGPAADRKADAWVVESDYLNDNDGTSAFINPFSTTLQVTNLGRKVAIDQWSETGNNELFLTAIGPSNVTFSNYQPYNENVFSLHDPLTGIADADTLSYLIVGWYSNPQKDPLAGATSAQAFADILLALDWQVKESGQIATVSLYHGLVYDLAWDKNGDIPVSDKPSDPSKSVFLSVGNTAIDALTELIRQQAAAQGQGNVIDADLLEAFQYNLLPTLDEANGPFLLDQAIHKAWFGAAPGGYEWTIVKSPSDQSGPNDDPYPTDPIDWQDPNLDPDWLATLNTDQHQYDQAALLLGDLQWQLYRLWWTQGRFDNLPLNQQKALQGQNPNFTDGYFADQLDPATQGSLAAQVQQQLAGTQALLSKVPHGDTPEELEQSILAYAKAHNLPDGYELKRQGRENFYAANDPVVLITGTKVADALTSDDALRCRFVDELISGFKYDKTTNITTANVQSVIPTVNLTKVPAGVTGLLDEFFFLDPGNATIIAAKVLGKTDPATVKAVQQAMEDRQNDLGTLPDLNLTGWRQPWAPLLLLWEVQYFPIAHDINGQENWTFDGDNYSWNGNGAVTTPFSISGNIFLTPQSSFNFKKRLDEFRTKHPDLDADSLQKLEDFITQTDDWDFLSQSLDGFTRQLALRDVESNIAPTGATLPTLIGHANAVTPMLGPTPQPFQGWPTSNFQQYRSGQFSFLRLMVVDRFGQSIEVVNSNTYLQFKPFIAPDMTPTKTVLPNEPYRFIQLSPRLLQPGRLAFDFVSATDDNQILNLDTGVNPVCAWVLPNHIDRSLACYDNSGASLGEVWVITDAQGDKEVHWQSSPNSPYPTLAAITKEFPHLGEFINGLITAGPTAFANFYQVVDETLWVVDPLGSRDDQNLSVLIGRPLALVRTQLQLQLDGPPISDPSWQYTFNEKTPDFINYQFPVRMGELAMRNDGLIGYFTGKDYSTFNAVHLPTDGTFTPASPPYVKPIGPGNFLDLQFQPAGKVLLTMLVDPRAVVHATTDILPVVTLDLPAKFVSPALANMEVVFHVGPLLTTVQMPATDTANPSATPLPTILLPEPAERNGVWHWLGIDQGSWQPYPVQDADALAQLSNIPPVLRTGYLQLKNGVDGGR